MAGLKEKVHTPFKPYRRVPVNCHIDPDRDFLPVWLRSKPTAEVIEQTRKLDRLIADKAFSVTMPQIKQHNAMCMDMLHALAASKKEAEDKAASKR